MGLNKTGIPLSKIQPKHKLNLTWGWGPGDYYFFLKVQNILFILYLIWFSISVQAETKIGSTKSQ